MAGGVTYILISGQNSSEQEEQIHMGTPEEKEARLLKALSLEKYMPASFLPARLVSSFSAKTEPVAEQHAGEK